MNAEEFWKRFRRHKIAVAIRNRDDQYAFWEAASAAGFRTSSKLYSIAQFPWAIFTQFSEVSGWTGGGVAYRPDTYMTFEDVKNILSGGEDIELCADGLESIL